MEDQVYETQNVGRYRVDVVWDSDSWSMNPRENYEHLGTIAHLDRRELGYRDERFGDDGESIPFSPNSYCSNMAGDARPIEFACRYVNLTGGVALPVQYQDYGSGGSRIRVGHASEIRGCDGWANGMVYVTAEALATEYATALIGPDADAKALATACMIGEVKEFDSYLRGEVYGFIVTDTYTDNVEESCWGFIGDPDCCMEEGLSVAHSLNDHAPKPLRKNKVGILA